MQYAWSRLDQIAAAQHWGDFDSSPGVQRAWTVLRSCETALNLASLLNFLVFLQQGKYRYVFALPVSLPVSNMAISSSAARGILRVLSACLPFSLLKVEPNVCRSLLERVLRARLVYQRANMARAISFEYLNRQLVWHELSELLLFVLPLISVTRLKRMIVKRWPSLRAATGTRPQECTHLHFAQHFDVCRC